MHELCIVSTIDGSREPVLFAEASGAGPRPLLVGLHTWSADRFNQQRALEPLARQHDWHLLLPESRGPNLRANPRCAQACGSLLARQDVLDAVNAIRAEHAVSEIFLLGGSGGGHMALMLAAYAPDLWSAVSSWCPITDVAAWHDQNPNYTPHIAACCGGPPGTSAEVDAGYTERSPMSHLAGLARARVSIHHGKHDASVPFTHTLNLYNRLVAEHPLADVYCEIFDGGHDYFPVRATEWFLRPSYGGALTG